MAFVDIAVAVALAVMAGVVVLGAFVGHSASCGDLPRAEAVGDTLISVLIFFAAARLFIRTVNADG